MAIFDELADQQREELSRQWIHRAFKSQKEIADFVARRRSRGEAQGIVARFASSYNFCFRIAFRDQGPDAIIRFPRPGCMAFPEEKISNEVQVIEFLVEKTTIPIPRLISWGLTQESPQQLGPFIISDFIDGVSLSSLLEDRIDRGGQNVEPEPGDQRLDTIYEQIADIMLQLFQFDFPQIGAISKHSPSQTWSVSGRPLTYRMNELATAASFPISKFPTEPFASARGYFQSLAMENITNLQTQRNIATSEQQARKLFVARHTFVRLVDKYSTYNQGPFKLFCDDFRSHNILVDPETLRITAIIDLEFTNAMPYQFALDPPWWLLLDEPETYLDQGHTAREFSIAFRRRLDQFLRAMQRAEDARGLRDEQSLLSNRMNDAWETKRFWFNYAARNPFDVESLCANFLTEDSDSCAEPLDEQTQMAMESFVKMKMEQLLEYDRDCGLHLH
ncbi:hypothetical protein HIM_06728 [Hirsutella minnesotensis 3608]|uniref:Uncharacterized protein n=1 Tax=Hirsutella minnesotensis 3608 TaxID=1043627 RepID=A0A0F7ZNJ0_9HYPO|nr:hypothetical protein HIM_06728 [Hirsutella minnesotensis 3608]